MKNAILFLLILLLNSCGNTGGSDNVVCTCYQLLLDEVSEQGIDFDKDSVSDDLQKSYDKLLEKSEAFKECNQTYFSSGKMRLFCMMRDDCLDCEKLAEVADNGPLMYYSIE